MLGNREQRTDRAYSVLSWEVTVAALALEKLRQSQDILEDEREALEAVARELESISRASQIPGPALVRGDERVPPPLRKSLFTLVALEEEGAPRSLKFTGFSEMSDTFRSILTALAENSEKSLDPRIVARAQDLCFDLLEQLS